ncbi:SICA antigen [Plasmodium coatneyi]|uniref:SICA antigen n=1 Tax=Plasmodium coatneyi TaxID=208452 RepID=A0A1B1DX91_9APIC|nr:SICA antigen [Plasmodium coatneyi]ANQ07249.1 SICA antigen [Plasmodium coatneyi]
MEDFLNFAYLIGQWQLRKGTSGDQSIWDDMKNTFEKLTTRIQNDKNEFKKLCEKVHLQDTTEGTVKKEICKALVQIKLFMSGIKVQEGDEYGFELEKIEEVESYFRCMIGIVTALKLFKGHSCLGEAAKYMVDSFGIFLDARDMKGEHGKCTKFDFQTIQLGKQFIGKEIEKWVQEARANVGIIRKTNDYNACKKSKEGGGAGAKGDQDQGLFRKLLGINNDTELEEWANTENSLSEEGAKEILKGVNDGKITDDDDLKNKVKVKIQEEKKKAANKADTLCNDDKLCERVKCVTQKWKKNRESEGGTVEWSTMWGDVVTQLGNMSKEVKKNEPNEADKLCDNNQWTGSFLNEKDREACRFINRGLKHINGVQIDQSDVKDQSNAEQKRKAADNRMFKQTMLCAVLNAYADLLKEKSEKKCPVDEGKIKQMFQKGIGQMSTWCSGGNCPECRRDVTYKDCTVGGDNGNQTNVENKLKTMLEGDKEIQKTLTSISSINNFCQRIQCVTKKWFTNNKNGTNPTWDNMKNDINNEATNMFKKISQDTSKSIPNYCSYSDPSSRRVTDPEIKACELITKGLKHIYGIGIEQDDITGNKEKIDESEKKRKAADNRDFKQTMLCLVLNAYADKLKEEVKSPCEVSEKTIAQSFEEGNKELTKSCKGKNSEKGHCVQCDRYDQYADCQIDSEKIGDKLETILRKDGNVQQTLTDISTINNTLCDRAQCVTTQWTRDRRQGGQRKWEYHIWDDKDMEKILNALSAAIANGYMNEEGLCKNIVDKDNTNSEAKKLACQLITAGLKHIYGITEDQEGTTEERKRNDKIFKQTMTCMALNVFASEMLKGRCKITEEILTQTFEDGKSLYTTMCSKSNNCQKCGWDSCAKPTFNNSNLRDRIKEELKKNRDITQTLNAINNICQPKPAEVAKPDATKPPTTPISTSESVGRTDPSAESDPAKSAPAPASRNPSAESIGKEDIVDTSKGVYVNGTFLSFDGPPAGSKDDSKDVNELFLSTKHKYSDTGVDATIDTTPSGTTIIHTPRTGTDTQTPESSTSSSSSSSSSSSTSSSSPTTQDVGAGGTAGAKANPANDDADKGLASTSQTTTPHAPSATSLAPDPGPPLAPVPGGDAGGGSQAGAGPTLPVHPVSRSSTKILVTPKTAKVVNVKKEGMDNIPDLLTPYLPTIPVFIGLSAMSYLLLKYSAFLGKRRKRYRRANKISGPSLEQQIIDNVDDQADGPHVYTLVKKRKPRSTPKKKSKKPSGSRRAGRGGGGVRRRMIIDIHLEVLDECQKGELHSTKEDFFEILVEQFMGSEFIKKHFVPEEKVPSSGSGFREEDFISEEEFPE